MIANPALTPSLRVHPIAEPQTNREIPPLNPHDWPALRSCTPAKSPCCTNADLQKFSALKPQAQRESLARDARILGHLLAKRAMNNGSKKLEILILDAKGGSGHTIASRTIKALLQDPNHPISKHVHVARADFYGDEEGTYAREFDAQMAAEDGWAVRLQYLLKNPIKERLCATPWGQRRVLARIASALAKEGMSKNPDIIISVQSFGICALSKVAQTLGAQLRVLPTDFGLMDWYPHVAPHASDDGSMRYDISVADPFVVEQLTHHHLHNFNVVGMPVRRAFSELPARLADPQQRAAAEAEIHGEMVQASNGEFAAGDRGVVVMMGGKGAHAKRFLGYIDALVRCAPDVLESTQKLHVFVPAATGRDDELEAELRAGVAALFAEFPQRAKQVRVHLLPRLEGDSLARLMKGGISITKAGGLTSFELASLGAKALLNMRLTRFLPWEQANVSLLQKCNLGFPLPTDDAAERAAMGDMLKKAWAAEPNPPCNNDFSTLYQKALVRDSIARLSDTTG